MIEFGTKTPGKQYVDRPGVYAIIKDRNNCIATIEVRNHCILPGGGIDPGESPEETLKRECMEELGWEISIISKIGEAVQYTDTHHGKETYFRKIGIFFKANLIKQIENFKNLEEPDARLRWLTQEEAITRMHHQSNVWAIQQAS